MFGFFLRERIFFIIIIGYSTSNLTTFSAATNCFRDCLSKDEKYVRATVLLSQGGKIAQFHPVRTETKHSLRVGA